MQSVRRRGLGSQTPQWLAATTSTPTRASIAPIQRRSLTSAQRDNHRHGRERVVILGSGWAGFTLSRALDPRKYQIVVVSPRSYFVFTPLLAGTSVGTLEFRTTLEPVRSFKARAYGAEFFQGWADKIDFAKKRLTLEEAVEDPAPAKALTESVNERKTTEQLKEDEQIEIKKGELFGLHYDKLVITVGCYAQTFNTPGAKENAYFLKDVGDARRIRNRLLSCFEVAALPTTTPEMKKNYLNFAVVGGGPTGIEWSAELYDMVHEDMKRLYPELIEYVKITVYDVAPNVLSMFDKSLGDYAMKTFHRNGIDIKTSHHIEELRPGVPTGKKPPEGTKDGDSLYTLKVKEEGEIGTGMVVWSTGLMMNPFVEHELADRVKLHERNHGLVTDGHLQIQDKEGKPVPDVYALGDCAVLEGTAYPATAQVASQKANWLAKQLNKGTIQQNGFKYKDLGVMAYIGNQKAIMQSGGSGINGRIAWLIWRGAYLTKTVSWRNKILIPIYWTINWLFGRDISRF
ncbi:putative NADH dehydrogenase [Fulvia fulva]|nr:putative NADH dehydrogenase [Fulvia fulva]WPV19663.1 putative NADH dehydrogenase [Fulvia fulva]WPV33789.1 putative NADH dehydrogenase [Fulvia fulva]